MAKRCINKDSLIDKQERDISMQRKLSTNHNPNYRKLLPYLPNQQFDESYALLSHYIQLQGNSEATEYQKILLENGVKTEKLPSTDAFNKEFDVPFTACEKPKFTFIFIIF